MKCLFMTCLLAVAVSEVLWDDKLKADLFENYNANALPSNDPVDVFFSLRIYGIIGIDTVTSLATMKGALRHYWTDKRLSWNPDDYGGRKKVRMPTSPISQQRIWIPDTALYQLSSKNLFENLDYTLAQVSYDGSIYWSTIGTL